MKIEQWIEDRNKVAISGNYEDYKNAVETNDCTKLIAALGKVRQNTPALMYGDYKELELQTQHFAYARMLDGKYVITTVNNGNNEVSLNLEAGGSSEFVGALSGERVAVNGGRIQVRVPANYGEIWIPAELYNESCAPIKTVAIEKTVEVKKEEAVEVKAVEANAPEQTANAQDAETVQKEEANAQETVSPAEEKAVKATEKVVVDWSKSYEDMTVEELQEAILEKMRKNGPVTDYMMGTVKDNTHKGSLVNWVRSFN